MITILVSWVSGIVFATLFATFLELLLPSSSMQKFIRVIMGLLIMLAILRPVIDQMERPADIDVTVLAPKHAGHIALEDNAQTAVRNRDKLIKDVYRRDLTRQMQNLVEGIAGVASAQVLVECEDTQAGPMKIRKVIVAAAPGTEKKSVQRVVIGQPRPSVPDLPAETAAQIQTRLCELYQLKPHQVIVKSMENKGG